MVILTEKVYDNEKGYFYIPVVWREEFDLRNGIEVGIDYYNDVIIIDKLKSREFTQRISAKGRLTIPHELRQQLDNETYKIYIIQTDEKIILTPE
jgi:bifunctional DNA-binding transcriptional regulator/antitoxin component of YhaV-PrlF toxin-antitoxin module